MLLLHEDATTLLELVPEALVVTDANGRVLFANARTEGMFGYPRQELIGQAIEGFLPSDNADHARRAIRKTGEEFPVEVSTGSVRWPGGVLISSLVRDATARRHREQGREREKAFAEQVNATKSRFLAAASHDLRQPLQSLGFYVSMLVNESDHRIVADLAERMTRPLESMRQILDSLLDIIELESGSIRTERRPVPVQALLDRAYEDNVRQASAKGLGLSRVPTDCIALTDPLLLQRVLANLVGNAIQHSEHGSVAMRCVRGEGVMRIEVSDTGPGIPADRLERIFDEYYQLDNPEHGRERGMGLGLSIVKEIAGLLEHGLEVVSAPGHGSVFSIEMPLVETMEPAESVAPQLSPPGSGRRPRIMLVDDDPTTVDATTRVLARAGLRVDSAPGGEEALALVRAGIRPDLLVTDYRLPGITGVELIRRVRDLVIPDLPSIVLTGDTSAPVILSALTNCTVLHKPVDSEALLASIEDVWTGPDSASRGYLRSPTARTSMKGT
jgi:signal transduction histidine kinase/ActR/RegA family two-component response regulator